MALTILYQDETLVAVDKPAGMLVHPGREPEPPENIAMKVLRDQLGRRIEPIHRLDRPTSGVLLFALDVQTSRLVRKEFEDRGVTKTYLAVVSGEAPCEPWSCNDPMRKDESEPWLEALTAFARLAVTERGGETFSLVRAEPHSGRFHQIRKHLLAAGLPIAGDYRYAGMKRSDHVGSLLGTGDRMLLQAKALEFTHPYSMQRIRIEAPLDADLAKVFPETEGGLQSPLS